MITSVARLTVKQARKRKCKSEMNEKFDVEEEPVKYTCRNPICLFFQELRDAKPTQGLCCYIRTAGRLNKNCSACLPPLVVSLTCG